MVDLYENGKKTGHKKMTSVINVSWNSHTKDIVEKAIQEGLFFRGRS